MLKFLNDDEAAQVYDNFPNTPDFQIPACRAVIDKAEKEVFAAIKNMGNTECIVASQIRTWKRIFLYRLFNVIEIEKFKSSCVTGEMEKDLVEIAKQLEKDYSCAIETLDYFNLIEKDLEKPGEMIYRGDYDGSGEPGGKGESFAGRVFRMPSFEEIWSRITPQQIKLYQEMGLAGLQPKLQLTPIAYQIRTLSGRIDLKNAELYPKFIDQDTLDRLGDARKKDSRVWENIIDEQLVYETDRYLLNEDRKSLQMVGGKSKSAWINENDGWIINIVPASDKNDENQSFPETRQMTNAEKTSIFLDKIYGQGYRGLSCETFLMAQMSALLNKKEPISDYNFTILPESNLDNAGVVINGGWNYYTNNFLDHCEQATKTGYFDFRKAIKIEKPKI